jgi:cyanophycinase-like exopeptidase
MDWWTGTEVQAILQSKIANVTMGGTSAGLAILGNWVFRAEYGSIDSPTALAVSERSDDVTSCLLAFAYMRTNTA